MTRKPLQICRAAALRLSMALATTLALVVPQPVAAQDDGPGFLTRLLQDQLSGAGREVRIRGFEGALSSRARMAEMTIADDEGIWLTLRDAELDWNRAALLRGRLSVNALSAAEILFERLPDTGPGAPPSPEATPFALPDLPVAVRIGELRAERVELGAALFGAPAVVRLEGRATLEDGDGDTALRAERIDGAEGRLLLEGSFSNATRVLALDLDLTEGPEGIAATLMGLPGAPALTLRVAGTGPLSDYRADIGLATDGAERLAGEVTLATDDAGAQRFGVDLGGDVAPLFAPEFRGFFGAETRLELVGAQLPDGRTEISRLDLAAEELALTGALALGPDGLPERMALQGRIGRADGAPVLLPLAGPRTRLGSLRLDLDFDAARGPDWTGALVLEGLERPDLSAGRIGLTATGLIAEAPAAVAADIDFTATGLAPTDPGLAEALGDALSGTARLEWRQGAPLALPRLVLGGEDYGLSGSAQLFEGVLSVDLDARLAALARFSGLADRPLGGSATGRLTGSVVPLSGGFDLDLAVESRDLTLDIAEADRLLAGTARIDGGIARDATGTTIRDLNLTAQSLTARIDGTLRSAGSEIAATLDFEDLGVLGPGYSGRLEAEARLDGEGPATAQRLTATATGSDITLGVPELDRLLAGESRIRAEARLAPGVTLIDRFTLGARTLAVEATGRIGDAGTELAGQLDFSDLGVLGPGYVGRVRAEARLIAAAGAERLRMSATGTDLGLGRPELDRLLAGDSRLALEATREAGAIDIASLTLATASGLTAEGAGRIAPEGSDFSGRLGLADLGVLAEGLAGQITAEASVTDTAGRQRLSATARARGLGTGQAPVDRLLAEGLEARIEAGFESTREGGVFSLDALQLTAPTGLSVVASGRRAPEDGGARTVTELDAEAVLQSLGALGPRFGGRLGLEARYRETDDGAAPDRRLELTAGGQDIVTGLYELDVLLRGASRLTLEATQLGERLRIRGARLTSPLLTAEADATVEGTTRRLDLSARLSDLAALVPGFDGPATATGTITDAPGNRYEIDLAGTAPGGIDARVRGQMGRDLTAALAISGRGNLALVNRFADPINIQGPLAFDLRLDGPLGLDALSGTVSTSGARVVAPRNAVTVEAIEAQARLGGGAVQLDATAAMQGGGTLAAGGRVELAPRLPAQIDVTLDRAQITDRRVFETRLSGALRLDGQLVGGGRVSGALTLADTEVRIPSTGLGAGGYVPPGMVHFGETPAQRATRERARLNGDADAARGNNALALDLTLSSPNRVFIRGRGLDAEFGGGLRLTGTTASVVPSGEFTLLRGRLDILGRRFTLSDGIARLTGRFIPYLRMTATTATDGITAQIVVEGEADTLNINFLSVPELPEEEVVARILFGRGLDRLSPFQAAQLASAVATLAGRGGEGLTGRLRQGFGLDDLDVATREDGTAALRVGRYLTERIYTDVTVDSEGRSEVSINLDVTPSVTVRGRTDSEGRSGLGIFFERDY